MAVIGFLYCTAPNLGLQARKGAPRETTFRRRREARGHRGQRSHQHGARGMGIRLQVSHVLLQITFACYWCLKINNCPFTASRRHCGQMNEHTGCSSWPTHTGALRGGKGMKLRERTTFWMRIVASGTLFSKMLGFSIKCHGSRSVSRYPLLCVVSDGVLQATCTTQPAETVDDSGICYIFNPKCHENVTWSALADSACLNHVASFDHSKRSLKFIICYQISLRVHDLISLKISVALAVAQSLQPYAKFCSLHMQFGVLGHDLPQVCRHPSCLMLSASQNPSWSNRKPWIERMKIIMTTMMNTTVRLAWDIGKGFKKVRKKAKTKHFEGKILPNSDCNSLFDWSL